MSEDTCGIEDCNHKVYAKALCKRHYYRQRYRQEHGIPLDLPSRADGRQFCKRGHDRTLPDALYGNGTCRPCSLEVKKAEYPARRHEHRDRQLRRKFGLTLTDWEALLASQGGVCAGCGTDTPGGRGSFHVDHDRACCPGKTSCGKCIRGLLCSACNVGVGLLGDDPERLRRLADYIEKARANGPVRT